jgi:hypothetical protein
MSARVEDALRLTKLLRRRTPDLKMAGRECAA